MSSELKDSIETYQSLKVICLAAKKMASINPDKYVVDYKLPLKGKKDKNRKEDINKFFDKIQDKLLENFFLDLVASFERVIFIKLDNASGNMKKILKKEYPSSLPFSRQSDNLVKDRDSIKNLNNIKDILKNKIPEGLQSELTEIIKYRDKLAHGKRFHEKLKPTKLEDVLLTLENILDEI
jgi:hypothetical protein